MGSIVIDKAIPKMHAYWLLTGLLRSYEYETDPDWWVLHLMWRLS